MEKPFQKNSDSEMRFHGDMLYHLVIGGERMASDAKIDVASLPERRMFFNGEIRSQTALRHQ